MTNVRNGDLQLHHQHCIYDALTHPLEISKSITNHVTCVYYPVDKLILSAN